MKKCSRGASTPSCAASIAALHFTLDEYGRNIALTDEGIRVVESALRCGNLFAESNLALYTAVHNAIHAHVLLRRDVDYVVKNGAIESVDQFKGRIAQDRRWPAGLHTAIEAKEGVPFRRQGRVLGSITLQNLVALYPAGLRHDRHRRHAGGGIPQCYGLEVEVIPTNRPVIRIDEPDVVFATKAAKEAGRGGGDPAACTLPASRSWWARPAWRNRSG